MLTWRAGTLLGLGALTVPLWSAPWLGVLASTAVVLALSIVDFALAAPVRLVTGSRTGDRTVRLGQTATVTVHLHNRSARTLHGEVRDAWVPSAGARSTVHRSGPPRAPAPAPAPAGVPGQQGNAAGQRDAAGPRPAYANRVVISPGGSAAVVTTLTPTRRGDRPAVRLSLRSFGPLGLAFRQRAGRPATPPWTVRVLPRFDSRRFLAAKTARLRTLDGSLVTRGRGQGTEFDTLREYVIGDDVRSIDWRASARRADVLVRTWRPERDRRVVCVLDTGRTSAVRIGDEPRLDAAIDAALLLAALASRAGDQVDLLAVDTAVRAAVSGAGRQVLLTRLVSALAPLHPALVETDFELVVGEVLRRERKRALVVLFTALEPGALGEGLLPVLPRLAARHQVIVAAVHDPVLVGLTSTPPARAEDAYAAAAAWRALAERDRVRAALTRHGVEVIDAPADVFASRVSDAYLRLKALGRL